MDDLSKTLVETLKTLFEPEDKELAYLSLTGKPELQVRDKLAYRLHVQLTKNGNFGVLREWKRRDLAVFQGADLKLLLEAKAAFTFDFLRPETKTNNFNEILNADFEKTRHSAAKHLSTSHKAFALLLVVNPLGVVPIHWQKHLKYVARKTAKTELRTSEELNLLVQKRIPASSQIAHGVWKAGRAFDTDVEVCYWLYGEPVSRI